MWQQSKHDQTRDMDEHNQPTEPMQRIVLPALLPPLVQPLQGEPTIDDLQTQDAQEPTAPLPPLYANDPTLPPRPVYSPPIQATVPALPPLPEESKKARRERPPKGADKVDAGETPGQKKKAQSRRSGVPLLVGLCFVAVQLVLLLRFVLSFLVLPTSNGWGESIAIVYIASDVLLFPFRLLVQQMNLSVSVNVELYTLPAILVYGIISRIMVRLLKIVLR